jgi:hypothetical protein
MLPNRKNRRRPLGPSGLRGREGQPLASPSTRRVRKACRGKGGWRTRRAITARAGPRAAARAKRRDGRRGRRGLRGRGARRRAHGRVAPRRQGARGHRRRRVPVARRRRRRKPLGARRVHASRRAHVPRLAQRAPLQPLQCRGARRRAHGASGAARMPARAPSPAPRSVPPLSTAGLRGLLLLCILGRAGHNARMLRLGTAFFTRAACDNAPNSSRIAPARSNTAASVCTACASDTAPPSLSHIDRASCCGRAGALY